MKPSAAIVGLALLSSGTIIGVAGQQFASADVSSGDRPVLINIEPCRLTDTRAGGPIGPRASKLGTADTFTIDVQEPTTDCAGLIPSDAIGLSLNVTAIGASARTFLTIWAGGDRPEASSLNPSPGAPPTPNAVTVDLSADQDFKVYNDAGSVDLLVDVGGYYVNHDHDDRYYTEAEVDTALGSVDAQLLDGFDSTDFLGAEDSAVDAAQLGGHPAVDYPRIRAIIRMISGGDGYTVEQGIDPGFTVTSSSPSVFLVGQSGSAARSAMESANCTSGFSDVQFSVYKTIDLGASPFAAELHLLQPDGSPLPFNGRAVFCTIWQ